MNNPSKPADAGNRRQRRKQMAQDEKNHTTTRKPKSPGKILRRARYNRQQHTKIGSGALTDVDQKIHWLDVKYNPVLRLDKRNPPTIEEAFELSKSAERIQYVSDKVYVLEDKRQKEVVGVVKFTPYEKMNEDDRKLLDETCEYIMKERKFVQRCALNKQMQTGFMGCFGYRKSMQTDEAIGSYIPPDFVKEDPELFAQWIERLDFRKRIEGIYAERFRRLANPLFKIQQTLLRKFKALSFGTLDHKGTENPDAFGGNLSFTMDCFSGIPHTDGDTPGGWSQGIWFQAFRGTGQMASQADDGFEVKDGEFYWPDFNVIVDFASCDGIVEILWRGAHDRHCTLTSHEPSRRFTRLGTSVQLGYRYATACANIVDITADEATLIKEPKATQKRKNDLVVGADSTVVEKKKTRFIKSPMYLIKELGERLHKSK